MSERDEPTAGPTEEERIEAMLALGSTPRPELWERIQERRRRGDRVILPVPGSPAAGAQHASRSRTRPWMIAGLLAAAAVLAVVLVRRAARETPGAPPAVVTDTTRSPVQRPGDTAGLPQAIARGDTAIGTPRAPGGTPAPELGFQGPGGAPAVAAIVVDAVSAAAVDSTARLLRAESARRVELRYRGGVDASGAALAANLRQALERAGVAASRIATVDVTERPLSRPDVGAGEVAIVVYRP